MSHFGNIGHHLIVAIIDHIPNGWVMWNMGTWLMTHDYCPPPGRALPFYLVDFGDPTQVALLNSFAGSKNVAKERVVSSFFLLRTCHIGNIFDITWPSLFLKIVAREQVMFERDCSATGPTDENAEFPDCLSSGHDLSQILTLRWLRCLDELTKKNKSCSVSFNSFNHVCWSLKSIA